MISDRLKNEALSFARSYTIEHSHPPGHDVLSAKFGASTVDAFIDEGLLVFVQGHSGYGIARGVPVQEALEI